MYQNIGNMILVESFKAIKVAAGRTAQMSFKITTFTTHVDSYQIFRTSNLAFSPFKLEEGSSASLSIDGYLRTNR